MFCQERENDTHVRHGNITHENIGCSQCMRRLYTCPLCRENIDQRLRKGKVVVPFIDTAVLEYGAKDLRKTLDSIQDTPKLNALTVRRVMDASIEAFERENAQKDTINTWDAFYDGMKAHNLGHLIENIGKEVDPIVQSITTLDLQWLIHTDRTNGR
jgi:hypothetical protein